MTAYEQIKTTLKEIALEFQAMEEDQNDDLDLESQTPAAYIFDNTDN